MLGLKFERGLQDCTLHIVDRAGPLPESYDVHVCADPLRLDCLGGDAPLFQISEGGRHSIPVTR